MSRKFLVTCFALFLFSVTEELSACCDCLKETLLCVRKKVTPILTPVLATLDAASSFKSAYTPSAPWTTLSIVFSGLSSFSRALTVLPDGAAQDIHDAAAQPVDLPDHQTNLLRRTASFVTQNLTESGVNAALWVLTAANVATVMSEALHCNDSDWRFRAEIASGACGAAMALLSTGLVIYHRCCAENVRERERV